MFKIVLILCFLFYSAISYQVFVNVHNTTAQLCPTPYNRQNMVQKNSIKVDIRPAYQVYNSDTLKILDDKGKLHTITFPGCYDVRLQMRLLKPISKPYTEAFMQMGSHIPCKQASDSAVGSHYKVCTNITQPNWCARSTNRILKDMTIGKETCHFCDVCAKVRDNSKKGHKFLTVLRGNLGQNCDFYNPYEPYSMTTRICTPSRDEIDKVNKDTNGQLREYWNFLKHGSLTVVSHLLERRRMNPYDKANCERLCTTYGQQHKLATSYAKTLEHQLEQMCTPKDEYVACIYSTIKFDVTSSD